MKDKKIYIGIKPRSNTSRGNEGLIFEEKEDGTYLCVNCETHSYPFTAKEIARDLKNGYIKPHHTTKY